MLEHCLCAGTLTPDVVCVGHVCSLHTVSVELPLVRSNYDGSVQPTSHAELSRQQFQVASQTVQQTPLNAVSS